MAVSQPEAPAARWRGPGASWRKGSAHHFLGRGTCTFEVPKPGSPGRERSPPGRCSAVKAPRGHPRRCLLRGAVGADHLLRADAAAHPVSVALRSSNLQGLGKVSNTLAPRAPMELGICCSIALLCCTNTSETCVAPGESTLHACSPASLHLVCTHAAGSADGTKDDGRSGGLTISRSSDSGPPGSC